MGMDRQALALGLDAGSVALKVVVTDLAGNPREQTYTRTQGRPVETVLAVLEQVLGRHRDDSFDLVAGTGTAGRLICQILGMPFINEVICQATAIRRLQPEVRTLIEMGGQDSKLIFLPDSTENGRPMVDFTMNSNCAAGTGSFLDQQASRLGIRIEEEFGRLALMSKTPPRVAGRCSVFAKSDMIHLQQQAAPVYDIVAGLCMGLARNLKSNLGRAMELPRPIAFCGGVAANRGVVHAIEEVFELGEGGLIVPECHACTGALGAVLVTLKERGRRSPEYGRPEDGRINLALLRQYLEKPRSTGQHLATLRPPSAECAQCRGEANLCDERAEKGVDGQQRSLSHCHSGPAGALPTGGPPIDAWFGLDVGSISTKAAVIDANHRVLAKIYLMTAGRPLDAVRRVLKEIGDQVGNRVRIRGAATTGSGRYLTGDFIGADLVVNEITAQATAAAVIDPEVDTIFEIGGQDSKYISLDHGVVVDFEMNHACAAGTGSFLEEQAERLGISIKGQFAELAFASQSPVRLGERCTVFMESDLLSHQQQGARVADLVAGLSYSIVSNYINRVVGHRSIGKRIFFQGGTAFNRGVVAAFERVTGRQITVPLDHEVTGAIGAAVLARRFQERQGRDTSNFGGFNLAELQCEIRSFACKHCSNDCEINEVSIPARETLYYGSRCDRYNVKKSDGGAKSIPNLFIERYRMLTRYANLKKEQSPGRPTVGIPLALSNHQLLPLWGTLLGELGFNVVVTPMSNSEIVERGVEAVLSTPCFPVKVAHGHVLELIEKGVDYVWLPSIISMAKEYAENPYNQLCPYVTSIPYQIEAALQTRKCDANILNPPVRLESGVHGLHKALRTTFEAMGISSRRLWGAVQRAWQAQQEFEDACRARGQEVLEKLDPSQRAVVIVSRPYNGCDSGVSLDLPNKLRKLGVLPIPMDFLDLRADQPSDDRVLHNMYWKYGQRILHAAEIIRANPRLHAIYLSNFSCGPDSFLISYFKRIMSPKPCLVLEIDEHSADAGAVTRLEAFLESLNSAGTQRVSGRLPLQTLERSCASNGHQRTLYIPWMGDHAYGVAAAFRACGQPAEVIPIANEHSMELGRRYCSGKECLPCIITAGDMVRLTRQPGFKPEQSAFFMPGGSGPCRFGQYNAMHKLILKEIGLPQIPIVSPSHDKDFYDQMKQLGGDPSRLGWYSICATEALLKACLAVRPYEVQRGRTDEVYQRWLKGICELIETRPAEKQIVQLLRHAAADFAAIKVNRSQPRPRIGVIGEMYVRQHAFANNDLLRQIESLGGEANLAGFTEYLYYCNWTRIGESRRARDLRQWFSNFITDRFQRGMHRRLNAPFRELLGSDADEPPTEEILRYADPYLHRSFEGEAVLSIGRMVELAHHGCHGIVNVMPFSCMPSTIVAGIMKKVTTEYGNIPALSINYDGQQDPTLQTRLEAFIYQARAYQRNGAHSSRGHATVESRT